MNNSNVSVPQIIILASGGVILIASFLDFYGEESAWGAGLVFVLAMLLGVASAVVVALKAFANTNLPERVLGFTWPQIHLVAGVYAVLLMIGWALLSAGDFGEIDKGAGLWLMFLAAIGLVVGAVMMRQEEAAGTAGPGAAPPTPF